MFEPTPSDKPWKMGLQNNHLQYLNKSWWCSHYLLKQLDFRDKGNVLVKENKLRMTRVPCQ